ncbi:MAG: DUF3683 domain-containing protein [Spirochaetes bacterium]|jgi:FAD/FMN-containing dehydrogenase/Fe-S oxidoreductase|nr:DUF3683 domain-containing protein [Spirochaetota bacterium]
MIKKDFKYREIPYNYTSFSDREIILRYFDDETADIIESLRSQRVTGRSAKLLFEIYGDLFIIDRNPYIFNDYLEDSRKQRRLKRLHRARLDIIVKGANGNPLVLKLVEKTLELDNSFFSGFASEKRLRRRIFHVLKSCTARCNIQFSAFHKVSHATDATDWRVEYPAVVVYPDAVEEIPGLIRAARKLGLSVIPRGGGTGLTGGAVPVRRNSIVINTEKLNRITRIEMETAGGMEFPVVSVEAGAVTEDVITFCEHSGYIFATDPTSAWASTIGGNIAENAGGKKCVMWGTAIDNLYSYTIVDAQGRVLEVKRRDHPYRKILPEDTVIFDVCHVEGTKSVPVSAITLLGTEIRKKGLGKDITNKALKGLPGVQKEGGDGIITTARFVLYHPFAYCKTICLEFFGNNLINASKAIVDIMNTFEKDAVVFLTALEHFDEKYVLAINYRNKSKRTAIPKAVLLVDIESNNEELLLGACERVIDMVGPYNTEGIIASDGKERELFWADRKNLGAIARHTNAFKLNEDVVIPLEKLPLFADFIEKLNLQKELENDIRIIDDVERFLCDAKSAQGADFSAARIDSFIDGLRKVRALYRAYVENFDRPAGPELGGGKGETVFKLIQDGTMTIQFEDDVITHFAITFHGYGELLDRFSAVVQNERKRKIIIATHMHAGDGNVHVNIPVHSNDYMMMREADETAGVIMQETVRLGGVISGEHGIGLTKLRFIDNKVLEEYRKYKLENDPDDLFNPGKLSADFPQSSIYTPSFNLLELEAFILEATDLESLSTSIAQCVRCGKCKSVCNTHYPCGTMFYNPRNKILGVGLIMEAVLYDAQTSTSLSFRNFEKLREISDHCTMCHRCQVPCPVNIDFGNITLDVRELMVQRKKSQFKAATQFTIFFLRRRGYYVNKLLRVLVFRLGYGAQRLGYYLNRPVSKITRELLPRINGYLAGRFPRTGQKSLRERLRLKGGNCFYSFENPDLPVRKSVVYFPGCGSERMFPEISIAVIALLYNAGVRVVIPPEFICCGYPMLANGMTGQADMRSYENRVLFHRIAGTTGYMDIEHIIVSCGTCFEMLEKYEIENIFNGASIMDINEFIAREEVYGKAAAPRHPVLYHEPCHTPLKHLGYEKTFEKLFGIGPVNIPNCCGEGGTLALSTPEISNTLRGRKKLNLLGVTRRSRVSVLTTCPSCVQGLCKINGELSVTGRSLAVYAAERFLGHDWEKKFIQTVKKKGIERILF